MPMKYIGSTSTSKFAISELPNNNANYNNDIIEVLYCIMFVNCTNYEIWKVLLSYFIILVLSTPKVVKKITSRTTQKLDQVCTCNSRSCLFIWTNYFKNVRYSQQSQELDQNLHDNGIDFTESYRRINTHGMRELVNI